MAQRLVEEGTVDYLKYRGVRLTDTGERMALKILRRHRLIETYLVRDLGYQLHQIHDEAEALGAYRFGPLYRGNLPQAGRSALRSSR